MIWICLYELFFAFFDTLWPLLQLPLSDLILNNVDLGSQFNYFLLQTGVPHYEDFISKAAKLHGHLK